MSSAWQRYRKLSNSDRHDFLLGFVLIPAAAVSVRLLGAGRWRHPARGRPGTRAESQDANIAQLEAARAAARMIEAASRYGTVRGNCLSKSVALVWLLQRKGIRAEMRIGARRTGDGLEAHAWVEMNGEIVNDAEDVRESFAAFEGQMTSQIAARK